MQARSPFPCGEGYGDGVREECLSLREKLSLTNVQFW